MSFYNGIIFVIWCDLTKSYDQAGATGNMLNDSSQSIIEMDPFKASLVMMYWAFTTLSTVGLGDFYPISNFERGLSAFGFLMGVAIFSYMLGNFAEII